MRAAAAPEKVRKSQLAQILQDANISLFSDFISSLLTGSVALIAASAVVAEAALFPASMAPSDNLPLVDEKDQLKLFCLQFGLPCPVLSCLPVHQKRLHRHLG